MLLLTVIFENLGDCFETYNLSPVYFYSTPGLAWLTALKLTKVKLELLNDIDILLMIGKRIREVICHSVLRYVNGINKYIKNYNQNKDSVLNSFENQLNVKN